MFRVVSCDFVDRPFSHINTIHEITRNAYNVGAWPTIFLLDKQGRIRWSHVGEGGYDEAERIIQKLLAEKETESAD